MKTGSTTTDIISKFETYLDDGTELSSAEELDLLNKKYQDVCQDRPWEFLKTLSTGTISVSGSTYYITLPSDFRELCINNDYTDNTTDADNLAGQKVIYVGAAFSPYQVINYSDRRRYLNKSGYVYLDMVNNRLVFTGTPSGTDLTYEFDYIKVPADLTITGTPVTPVFPVRFWDILYHMMAVDDQIIQLQDRSHSYMNENNAAYMKYLKDIAYWNSNLTNN